MSWIPTTDFENEVVSMQPHHDFIFGSLNDPDDDQDYFPRPESHLRYVEERKKKHKEQIERNSSSNNRKLDIIAKVQRIAGTKPLGEQPTLEDWDDDTNVERETIAMMRHLGLQPNIEVALDEKRTIATLPLSEEMLVMHNGAKRMPIFYNDKYFKLKPRVPIELEALDEPEETSDGNQSTTSQFATNARASISTSSEDNKLNNTNGTDSFQTAADSSIDIKRVNGDEEGDQSFNTASSSDYISTRSWYRSMNSSMNSSTASSRSSFGSSVEENQRKESRKKQPERFYTAKELYFKNRKN